MENARNLFVDFAPAPAGPDRGIRTMLGSLPSLVPTSSLPIGCCHLALDSNGTNHRKKCRNVFVISFIWFWTQPCRTWLEFTNVGVRMFIEVKRYVQGEHTLILVRRYVIAKLVNPSQLVDWFVYDANRIFERQKEKKKGNRFYPDLWKTIYTYIFIFIFLFLIDFNIQYCTRHGEE